jgi:hypothetical protein
MTTCAEYTDRLAEAEAALHQLQIGGKVVSVQMGEKRVEYSKAAIGDLSEYVVYLRSQVDGCNGLFATRRRAFGVIPIG